MFRHGHLKEISVLFVLRFLLSTATNSTTGLGHGALPDTTHAQGKEKQYMMLITAADKPGDKQMSLLQNGREVYNKTLPDMQVPEISAMYETATMLVVNNTAYIGGFNGTVYELHVYELNVSMDDKEVQLSVNMSTINLQLPCIPEVFVNNGLSVSTACFGNKVNTVYFVNIHSPTERNELKFTSTSYLSNILAVGNAFYFVLDNYLIRANTIGKWVMETLQDCIQPWLTYDKYHFVVINCQGKSIVFLPPEWSTILLGIWEGEWENKTVHPCHGDHTTPLVFSVDGTEVTFYNIYNRFQRTIELNGDPNIETITCTWSNNDLVITYGENKCDCWMEFKLNDKFEYKNLTAVPFANGTLHPLSTDKGDINQSVLLFYRDTLQYLLLPSMYQTLLDLKTGFAYKNITNKVVLYHGMVFVSSTNNGSTGNQIHDKSSSESHSWTVYVSVVGAILFIILIVALAVVSYLVWRHRRHNRVWSPVEDTHRVMSPTDGVDSERARNYTEKHKMIITQATETHLTSLVATK